MTRPQPKLSQLPLWERHVNDVLAVLRDALHILSKRWPSGNELVRNRALAECLLLAVRNRFELGLNTLDCPLFNEAHNQPTPETEGESAERKIPDFQYAYIDHSAPDPLYSSKYFVVECKRLGKIASSGWNFNENYVDHGIVRFVDPEHRYGKNAKSGAMVGYIDGESLEEILQVVNAQAEAHNIPPLSHVVQANPLNELGHELTRSFPDSPFKLMHFWISNDTADGST